ncbi:putative lipoprotein [Clostridium sporogenes]|uniref:hypothetical protein n=1 Tax=Clostridium TaxID=1485 RepID=UPI00090C7C98|nr:MULTISPECIES: hypothetical protein [Clostridium]APF27952.1 putative lipoprotein [Clostridium sporogenes]WMU98716.1 hypothetical protein QA656_05445 [Clostridium botulinum]
MIMKKLKGLFLGVAIVILLNGCSRSQNIVVVKDTLEEPIIHSVYKCNEKTKADVLSIFNSTGDVKITKSDTDDLKVMVKLVQTKDIKDIDKKLNNLAIKPQIKNNVIFYEPLCANNTTRNYWEWIKTNLNANGIRVNFDVEIPTTIKEVRIYNDIGNIDLENITAKIYTQTDIGNVTGKNINPLDSAIFKVNIPSTEKTGLDVMNGSSIRKTGIDVKFSNINNVNNIIAGVESGKINLKLPLNASYNHKQVKSEDVHIKYPFKMNSKNQFEYCKEQSLQKFKSISSKYSKTVITTGTNNNSSDDILIKKE